MSEEEEGREMRCEGEGGWVRDEREDANEVL